MIKPETRFKNKLFDKLKEIPRVHVIKIEAGAVRGILDVILCVNGYYVATELKMPGNKRTPLQIRANEETKNAGGQAYVTYPKDLDSFLDDVAHISSLPPPKLFE